MKIRFWGEKEKSVFISGGSKRFNRLYGYFKEKYQAELTGPNNRMLSFQWLKNVFFEDRCDIHVSFDERYLLYSIFLDKRPLLRVFCPRGNKIVHAAGKSSKLRIWLNKFTIRILYKRVDLFVFQTNN